MQAGARVYPEPPFPKQHQPKPGLERALDPQPMYDAPFYKGSEKLRGKVAIITGGDSGIGRSVAILYAREGADVVICHLGEDQDALDTQAAIEKEGRRCLVSRGDVSDPAYAMQVVDAALRAFGRIDILVNNAAFQVHTKDIEDLSLEHFDLTLKTNLYGYFLMAKAVIPHLAKGSAIINTGSVTGIDGSKELLDYSMTKGGIHAFTRSLASNLVARGIRVNCVAPGPIRTDMLKDAPVEEMLKMIPAARLGEADEVASLVAYLCGDDAAYITRQVIGVNGGMV